MAAVDDTPLARAIVTRDGLVKRMTFWDKWRNTLMLPMIVAGGAAGLALGYAIETALHWPDRTRFFAAVLGILAIGRWVTAFFDMSKLEVARRRVQQLQRRG